MNLSTKSSNLTEFHSNFRFFEQINAKKKIIKGKIEKYAHFANDSNRCQLFGTHCNAARKTIQVQCQETVDNDGKVFKVTS